jgi:hypothetical protein
LSRRKTTHHPKHLTRIGEGEEDWSESLFLCLARSTRQHVEGKLTACTGLRILYKFLIPIVRAAYSLISADSSSAFELEKKKKERIQNKGQSR